MPEKRKRCWKCHGYMILIEKYETSKGDDIWKCPICRRHVAVPNIDRMRE